VSNHVMGHRTVRPLTLTLSDQSCPIPLGPRVALVSPNSDAGFVGRFGTSGAAAGLGVTAFLYSPRR
jgi:hypothetical protein